MSGLLTHMDAMCPFFASLQVPLIPLEVLIRNGDAYPILSGEDNTSCGEDGLVSPKVDIEGQPSNSLGVWS